MGRKSSAKKKRREQKIKEETKKSPKKGKASKKLLKKTTLKKAKAKKKLSLKPPPPKIFGGILALIMVTILIIVGTTLFNKAFRPVPIAELLPAEETVAFVELNTNFEHIQMVKAKKLLLTTEYSLDKSISKIEENLSIDVGKDIQPWLGRQIGIAEIVLAQAADETQAASESISSIYFLEAISKKPAREFLQKMAENNLSELKPEPETTDQNDQNENDQANQPSTHEIQSLTLRYPSEDRSLDTKIYTTFIKDYLVLTPSLDALHLLIETQDTSKEKVSDDEKYEEALSKAPVNKVAFIYLNFDHSPDILLQKYGVFTESSLLSSAIQPFAELFNSEGAVLIAKDDYFVVESFMGLDEAYLKGDKNVTYKERYDADLTNYVPENPDVFLGGTNVEKQVKRLVALFSEGNQSTTQVFEGVLQNYTEKYFGNSISVEEDIYPLVQNEFAFSIKNAYTLALELEDPSEDALKLHKIANNFISSGTVFEPHIEEHELPDGTIAKEIVATPEELIKSESKYDNVTIYEMETESKSWGAYYTVVGSIAIISTNKDTLTESLKLVLDKETESLKTSKIYPLHIAPALKDSDEVAYFNILKFWPTSGLIKSISTAKEYYGDGIMAHHYIYVE